MQVITLEHTIIVGHCRLKYISFQKASSHILSYIEESLAACYFQARSDLYNESSPSSVLCNKISERLLLRGALIQIVEEEAEAVQRVSTPRQTGSR